MTKYKIQLKDAEGNFYYPNTLDDSSLPIGTMLPYSSKIIPNGFLPCDGSAVSRTEYAELFKIIGTSYGAGDGSTTFNLPNKKGRVSVGLDLEQSEFNTIGKKSGSKYMQKHTHKLGNEGAWLYGSTTANLGGSGKWAYRVYETNVAGEGDSGNLQPYEVDQWIIKAFNGAYSQPVSGDVNDTLPVGGIIKFDGDYIPEGYEEVENPENTYSLEEKRIGTWIDGKSIYRKVVQYNKSSTGNIDINLSNFGITNVENIWLNHKSFIKNSGGEYKPVNNLEATNIFSFCNFPSTTQMRLSTNNAFLTGMWNLIIEYTKTTD